MDFITPVVDDPFIYGQIAAANSLSDIFAKGAKAISAMNVLMWDKERINKNTLKEILSGALDKLIEAHCPLVGGHSIIDVEQKFGLSVNGLVSLKEGFIPNNTAKEGDKIILTKPIGVGILTTAMKNGILKFNKNLDCIRSMQELNLKTIEIAKRFKINACTDVTGFGLIGHLSEMVNNYNYIELTLDEVPLFNLVEQYENNAPGGSVRNMNNYNKILLDQSKSVKNRIIFHDAQTSGGLLLAIKEDEENKLISALNNEGINAKTIGEFKSIDKLNKQEYKEQIKLILK